MGNVSKISANATARQPTKIPADIPNIVSILLPNNANIHFFFHENKDKIEK